MLQKRPNNNLLEKKSYELEPNQKIQKRMASSSTSDQQQQQEQQKDYHKYNMWRVDSMYNPAVSILIVLLILITILIMRLPSSSLYVVHNLQSSRVQR